MPAHTPFPFEAVRDLLGIVRAMYVAARRDGAVVRCRHLGQLGRELRLATDLAMEHASGTPGRAEAWRRAEAATLRLADLVDSTTPLESAVAAAVERVRPSARRLSERALERRARRTRG
jgi:hypothetical protein